MTAQKQRLVMDVVAPTSAPEPPAEEKHRWMVFKRLRHALLPARKPANKVATNRTRHSSAYALGVVVIVMCTIFGGWALVESRSGVFPHSVMRSAKYPLYYPKGTGIDPHSISYTQSSQLLEYTVHFQGHLIYMTEQPRPDGFNFDTFNKQIQESTQLLTPAGTATIGVINSRRTGSLVTSDSWILATSTLNTPGSVISALLQKLTY